jgi:hypothetical protein
MPGQSGLEPGDRKTALHPVRTAETHRAHIVQKLRLATRADLVHYALRVGLLDPTELAAFRALPAEGALPARIPGPRSSDFRTLVERERSTLSGTGPARRFRPEPATHRRATRARRGAPGERTSPRGRLSLCGDLAAGQLYETRADAAAARPLRRRQPARLLERGDDGALRPLGACPGLPHPAQWPAAASPDRAASGAVTLACGGTCPYVSGIVEDWDVPHPAGRPLGELREIRDELERRVVYLIGKGVRIEGVERVRRQCL